MSPRGATLRLLCAVAVAVGLDVVVRWPDPPPDEVMLVAPFPHGAIDRIELGRPDARQVLTHRDGHWWLGSGARADDEAVARLVSVMGRGLVAEAVVHDEALGAYGLAGGREIPVRMWSGDARRVALVVGDDTGGGSTWVRAEQGEGVASVRLGGREVVAGPWLDRVLLSIDRTTLREVRVDGPSPFVAVREDGAWFGADGPGMEHLLDLLEAVRVVRWLPSRPADAEPWVTVGLQPGAELVVSRVGAQVIGSVGDRHGLLGAADLTWVELLPRVRVDALYRRPWRTVESISVQGPSGAGALEASGAGWRVVSPAGIDAAPKRLEAVVRFLASPRLQGRHQQGFTARRTWTVRFPGETLVLQLGDPVPQGVPVRLRGEPGGGWIDPRLISAVEGAFGLLSEAAEGSDAPGG